MCLIYKHSFSIYLSRMVKLGQAPIDEAKFSVFVIDHYVVRFDIPVHDAHAVTVVQSLQQLVKIAPSKKKS